MKETITLEKIKDQLDFFNKMYDVVRIVDPVRKRVLESKGKIIGYTDGICYDYWNNETICDNCISIRAYQDQKSFVKLEYEHNANVIMMVTAIPMENSEIPVILELLSNVTHKMMFGTFDDNEGQSMHDFVSEMNNKVSKDSLTNLYNRRYIDERLPVDIIKGTVSDFPLAIIFIDVDDFKNINDTYGHATGDMVLKELGKVLLNAIRTEIDWAARYGGDEFLVCLNHIGYDEAYSIAERIRSRAEAIHIPVKDETIPITLSIGIHTTLEKNLTAEEIIALADEKMYQAKKGGKNRTVGCA